MKTVSVENLAQRVAQELSAPEPQTRAVLDRAVELMRKELQRGNRIDIGLPVTIDGRAQMLGMYGLYPGRTA